MSGPVGIFADLILVIAVSIAIFQISRRNKINHANVLSEVEGASEVIASPRQVRKAAAVAKKAASKKAASATSKKNSSKAKAGKK
jgi:PiT family inorganic phosphate transporter